MAFLCPSRLGKKSQKKGYQSMMRRLVGDGDVDSLALADLVKLSYYIPDARRIVLQNFTACAAHEISVKQAQKVNFIYSEGDWAYVATDDKKQGFIPLNACAKIGKPSGDKGMVRRVNVEPVNKAAMSSRNVNTERQISVESGGTSSTGDDGVDESFSSTDWSYDSNDAADNTSDVTIQERGVSGMVVHSGQPVTYVRSSAYDNTPMFFQTMASTPSHPCDLKPEYTPPPLLSQDGLVDFDSPPSPTGIYKVLYDYTGTDTYDVTVSADDVVFLLDARDRDWFWVQLPSGTQGYVPSNYIALVEPFESPEAVIDKHNSKQHRQPSDNPNNTPEISRHQTQAPNSKDGNTHGTVNTFGKPNVNVSYVYDKTVDGGVNDKNKTSVSQPPGYRSTSQSRHSTSSNRERKQSSKREQRNDQGRKHAPKKPPRKKKLSQELSPRSIDSLDSLDTTFDTLDTTCDTINTTFDSRDKTIDNVDSGFREHNELQKHCHDELDDLQACDTVHVLRPDEKYSYHHNLSASYDGRRGRRESSKNTGKSRPSSMPVFTSCEEEYKRGYFDQIFYEEKDTNFGHEKKHQVVNVSEILKMRARNRPDEIRDHVSKRSVPNMKEYLLNLPTSTQEKCRRSKRESQPREPVHARHDSRHRTDTDGQARNSQELEPTSVEAKQNAHLKVQTAENVGQGHQPTKSRTADSHAHGQRAGSCNDLTASKHYREDIHKNNNEVLYSKHGSQHHTDRRYGSASNLTVSDHSKHSRQSYSKDIKDRLPPRHDSGYKSDKRKQERRYGSNQDLTSHPQSKHGNKTGTGDRYSGNRRPREHYSSTNDLRAQSNTECEDLRPRSNSHGTKQGQARKYAHPPELNNIQCSNKTDWSFGYPRIGRQRQSTETNITVQNQSTTVPHGYVTGHHGKSKHSDHHRYTEETKNTVHELIHQTGSMLATSSSLDSDTIDSDVFESDSDDNDTETEAGPGFDGTNKCYVFLSSNTIGITGMGANNADSQNVVNEIVLNRHDSEESELGQHSTKNVSNHRHDASIDDEEQPGSLQSSYSNRGNKSSLLDIRGITEFVSLGDYTAKGDSELDMKHGEVVHVGLDGQDTYSQYWAYSPRLRKYGYVPKSLIKIPMVTII